MLTELLRCLCIKSVKWTHNGMSSPSVRLCDFVSVQLTVYFILKQLISYSLPVSNINISIVHTSEILAIFWHVQKMFLRICLELIYNFVTL